MGRKTVVVVFVVLALSACGGGPGAGVSPQGESGGLERDEAKDVLATYFDVAALEQLPCIASVTYRRDLSEAQLKAHGRELQSEGMVSEWEVASNPGGSAWIEYRPVPGSSSMFGGRVDGYNRSTRIAVCTAGEVIDVEGVVTSGDGVAALVDYTWRPAPNELVTGMFTGLVVQDVSDVPDTCQDSAPFILYDDGWRLAEDNFYIACEGAPGNGAP